MLQLKFNPGLSFNDDLNIAKLGWNVGSIALQKPFRFLIAAKERSWYITIQDGKRGHMLGKQGQFRSLK